MRHFVVHLDGLSDVGLRPGAFRAWLFLQYPMPVH